MVAGFEGDHGGEAVCVGHLRQRIHLGVRGAGPAVPALRDDGAVGGEEHRTDLRIAAGHRSESSELERTPHRCDFVLADAHPVPPSGTPGWLTQRLSSKAQPSRSCCLPSGLTISRLHHRRCRSSTGSTARMSGSRTITAGSDSHRPRSTYYSGSILPTGRRRPAFPSVTLREGRATR